MILYSNIPPLKAPENGTLFTDYFWKAVGCSDQIVIASGYASKNSLLQLDNCIREAGIKKATVILGMYYIEGCPESIYNIARKLDEEWKRDKIGEIRFTKSMKYHGKVYGFYKNGSIFSAISGSGNLSAVVKDAGNLRQYELLFSFEEQEDLNSIDRHLGSASCSPVSVPLSEISDIIIIHEENQKLKDVEGVDKVSDLDVETYKNNLTSTTFEIPLKVPGIPESSQDFMKSNVNKCYAKGRLNSKTGVVTERGWWETEIIVSNSLTSKPDYPEKNEPFIVVTDDGWMFKAHVSGDHLVASGLIDPVDSPAEDLKNTDLEADDIYHKCKGVITYQKLCKYGRTSVTLTKTSKKHKDKDGEEYDVWFLSFLPKNVK